MAFELDKMADFRTLCQNEIIRLALKEDIYSGDVTSQATIPDTSRTKAILKAKASGIISGMQIAEMILTQVTSSLTIKPHKTDGDRVQSSDTVFIIEGKTRDILTYERTILNFMQRMSGIATKTRRYVDEIDHTSAKILDTRKTSPGLRFFDKQAVVHGGGQNHRIGLFDMILIKDNHIDVSGGVVQAIQNAKSYIKQHNSDLKIEVEVRNLPELQAAITQSPDIILLDNMSLSDLKKSVSMVSSAGNIKTEASGGVNLETVKMIAETGVDFISVGALTHSVNALDLSLVMDMRS